MIPPRQPVCSRAVHGEEKEQIRAWIFTTRDPRNFLRRGFLGGGRYILLFISLVSQPPRHPMKCVLNYSYSWQQWINYYTDRNSQMKQSISQRGYISTSLFADITAQSARRKTGKRGLIRCTWHIERHNLKLPAEEWT